MITKSAARRMRRRNIKTALFGADFLYRDLASRAGVSERMVRYWVAGRRGCERLDHAFEEACHVPPIPIP